MTAGRLSHRRMLYPGLHFAMNGTLLTRRQGHFVNARITFKLTPGPGMDGSLIGLFPERHFLEINYKKSFSEEKNYTTG